MGGVSGDQLAPQAQHIPSSPNNRPGIPPWTRRWTRPRTRAGLGPLEALHSGMQMAALLCGHTCSSFSHICVLTSCSHQDPYYIALGFCHQTQSHSHGLGVRAET